MITFTLKQCHFFSGLQEDLPVFRFWNLGGDQIFGKIQKNTFFFSFFLLFFWKKCFFLNFLLLYGTTNHWLYFIFAPPPPDPPLIFLVFELRKWPGYQKCSKMFKVFEFFGFESKFSFCKRLGLKWLLTWKKNSKKMRFLTIFESNF